MKQPRYILGAGLIVVLGVLAFLLMEHPIAFWLVFVPLALLFVFFMVLFLAGSGSRIGNLLFSSVIFIVMVFALALVASPGKCDHTNLKKNFSFQFEGSTAASSIKPICENCNQYFESTRFRGTPNDLSYLEVVKEYISADEIVSGEYHTMTAIVTVLDHDYQRVRIHCKVENDDIGVFFSVEFKEEFEEAVSLLQKGQEITFRGKLYDTGFGWTDCELLQ